MEKRIVKSELPYNRKVEETIFHGLARYRIIQCNKDGTSRQYIGKLTDGGYTTKQAAIAAASASR